MQQCIPSFSFPSVHTERGRDFRMWLSIMRRVGTLNYKGNLFTLSSFLVKVLNQIAELEERGGLVRASFFLGGGQDLLV